MRQDVKVHITNLFLEVVEKLINTGLVKNERAFCQSIKASQQIFSDIKAGRRKVTIEMIYYTCFEYKMNPNVFFPVSQSDKKVKKVEIGLLSELNNSENAEKVAPKMAPNMAPKYEILNETVHNVSDIEQKFQSKNSLLTQEISELKEKLRYADLAIESYQRTVKAFEDMERMKNRLDSIEKKIDKTA